MEFGKSTTKFDRPHAESCPNVRRNADPPKLPALFPTCMHYRLNWPEKGVYRLLISAGCLWYCFDWLMPDARISRVYIFLQCSGGKWRRVVFRITYVGEAAVQTSFSGGEMGVNQSSWRWRRLLWRGRAAADLSRDSVVDYCPLREDRGCGHSS